MVTPARQKFLPANTKKMSANRQVKRLCSAV